MQPDDPRHGTYAGYIAHRHPDAPPACPPCMKAAFRWKKRYEVHGGDIAQLPECTWDIINRTPDVALSRATGLARRNLGRLRDAGPGARVKPSTITKIEAAQARGDLYSYVGVVRRLQALAALGWSGRELSERSGVHADAIACIKRRGADYEWSYMEDATGLAIVRVYRELHMTPAPRSRGSVYARNYAERLGYAPPLAWTDIDDPAEKPDRGATYPHTPKTDVDEAVVLRVMAGENLPMTTAERTEVVARLRARGWSLNEIETRTPIGKADRYIRKDDAA